MVPAEKIQDLGYLAVEAPDQVIAQLGAAMADVQVTAAAAVIAVPGVVVHQRLLHAPPGVKHCKKTEG